MRTIAAVPWEVDDQYMFGDDFLVAPVLQAGARARWVYLPNWSGKPSKGKWHHVWTNATFDGEKNYSIAAPLDSLRVNSWTPLSCDHLDDCRMQYGMVHVYQ